MSSQEVQESNATATEGTLVDANTDADADVESDPVLRDSKGKRRDIIASPGFVRITILVRLPSDYLHVL